MTLADLNPAERHRRVAATFTERVRAVEAWDVPAPVAGWTARDVVRHLVEWFPPFLAAGAGVGLPGGPSVDDEPVAAWRTQCNGVQALLDDPGTARRSLTNPHIGELPLDRAVDQFYTPDVFMHTWDLARATGQDDRLDPDFCAALLAGMEPAEEMIRSSGQYGPRVAVPDDADARLRLLGFIGRDPFWTPHRGAEPQGDNHPL
ncbi:TIGR03086 family metal-binding protein [Micromonospora okii]|uniref:TIGR03086 family metal-binding protein n=1 Tax=Micromonospora okii TaxID=1182970 RepID=UPI001E3D573C|nr:TIGR03086 family metal-binding protein [Micromonospora okii]